MRRAIVHNPKQPFPRPIRFLRQHLLDQPAKGFNPGCRFTPTHHISPAYVPGGQILQGTTALVFVLDIGRSPRCERQGGMAAAAGLDTGLLVGAEDVVLGTQGLALPHARIEVQNRAGLVGKLRVPWKYPVLVAPRFDGICSEYPPHGAATDRFAQRVAAPSSDIGQGLSAQRLLGFCNQFTGDRLDQRVVQRGKKPPCGPVPPCLQGQSPPAPNGGATVALNTDGAVPVLPPRCWTPAVVEPR